MRILDRSVYVGPSLHARFPVIRLELDLGELEQWPTGRLGSKFVDTLALALPGLAEHGCSYGEPGGFFRRMREDEGTWLGHVLEHVAIELQNIAGEEVTFGKTRGAGRPGVYTVVYEYAQRDEGIAAGDLGLRLLCSLLPAAIRPDATGPDGWKWLAGGDAVRASTNNASKRRSPAAPRTLPSNWPATRRKPTRFWVCLDCRSPSRNWSKAKRRPFVPRGASDSRS